MNQPALHDCQRWLLTAMMASGGLDQGLALARLQCGADETLVAQPPRGERRDRIGIYHHGYWMRLLECLRADYPMLRKLLGGPMFDWLARGYLAAQPSRTPSLHDLGCRFADFLAATQPDPESLACQLPVALARLERALAEVGRAQGLESKAPAAEHDWLTALAGGHPLAGLRMPDSVRLLQAALPVHEYWRSLQEMEEAPATPARQDCWLTVSRVQWRVQVHAVTAWQYRLLQSLGAGSGGDEAMRLAAESAALPPRALLAQICLWLPSAQQLGLLCREG
ncbi:HvfC/BufC N-terminal domain-containing protein [Chromobacterium paludis]|uniref:HvfC/BufC N-terminal domain-containing protein n=1 Tax=Chromobacterium paludis TaxID=2605945 RepID=UPI00143DBE0C|nr:DNA-binding domain-containing protein [Chromobacterium paludis]